MASVSVCAINFWPGFTLDSGFLNYLLRQVFDSIEVVENEDSADIVVSSVFTTKRPRHPERTICFIWENVRPDYNLCAYSISGDFDSYNGRNCRLPLWYPQLQWPGFVAGTTVSAHSNHGFEAPVDIDSLLRPRRPRKLGGSDLFCSFVASAFEPHRMFCVERLMTIGHVDVFGNCGAPLRMSKYDILPRYRFNLCFENSSFPGYYTEKVLHAWAGGCVPLYFSDQGYAADFNPKAILNRIDFRSIDEFVDHVATVNNSPSAYNELFEQPLLTTRPTLEHAIAFLRAAGERIMQDTRQKRAAQEMASVSGRRNVSRNSPCPCGSGRKFKHCHGALS